MSIGCKRNTLPNKPVIIAGISSGRVNVSYEFSATATDPDGDSISIRFDWNDGDTSGWSNYFVSGETIKVSHIWQNPGTYSVKAQARDKKEAISDWSESFTITIIANHAPNPPATPSGPTTVFKDSLCSFKTVATDPDGDSVAIRFAWDDGDTSDWSFFVASAETVSLSHSWQTGGTYAIRAQAKDKYNAVSNWSDPFEITIIANRAPNPPATPTGPSQGRKDSVYTFSTVTTDPDGDAVCYRFAFGDGDTSDWTNWVQSGTPVTINHSYQNSGTYSVKAQAKDVNEVLSSWSNPHMITITNLAPNRPTIPQGYSTGIPNVSYNFSSLAFDPDGDSVAIRFSWGDGDTSNWSSFVASGDSVRMAHSWRDTGIYYVKAQAKDKEGATSGWSDSRQIHIRIQGELKWRYQTGEAIANSPAIASNGTIYFGSADNYLYALNPNGTLKWRYQAGADIGWSSPSIAPDGTIYVGCNDNYLYAIDSTGRLKWRYQAGHFVYSSPGIAADGTIYFGGPDNYLYAVYPNGTLRWRYYTDDDISTSPAIAADGTVYIASIDDCLYALNPNGTLKWRYETGYYANASPSIDADGTIYFGSCDRYLYALNPDGTLKWRYQTGSYVQHTSASIGPDGTIYFGSYDNYLYALNPNGTLKWRYQTNGYVRPAPAIASDGTIYFVSDDGYLYALNSNGTMRWRYQIGSPGVEQYSHPTIAPDGTVYVGSSDGWLYAIYGSAPLANTPWPKFHHDLKNTGRVGGP
jgi:outer membrane protein assembly factor BamB